MKKEKVSVIKCIAVVIIAVTAITLGYHCIVCVLGLNMHETVDCNVKFTYRHHKPQISEYCSIN